MIDLALLAHHVAQTLEFFRHPFVEFDDVVERLGDLAGDAAQVPRQAHGEVAAPKGAQGRQELTVVDRVRLGRLAPAAAGSR